MKPTIARNLVMRHGVAIGICPIEKDVIWQIIDHDHGNKGWSFPSESTIGKLVGVSERHVRTIVQQLESKKLIKVKRQFGFSNKYYYGGVKKKLAKFWNREQRREQKKEQPQKITPELQIRQPRNQSSGDPGTTVPPNTATAFNTACTYTKHDVKKKKSKRRQIKDQLEFNFNQPKEVVDHLRNIAAEDNEAATIVLMILEQLWNWGHKDEILKSWKWFLWAAWMWPAIVSRAWGEVKARQLEKGDIRKPGAILTLKIQEYSGKI